MILRLSSHEWWRGNPSTFFTDGEAWVQECFLSPRDNEDNVCICGDLALTCQGGSSAHAMPEVRALVWIANLTDFCVHQSPMDAVVLALRVWVARYYAPSMGMSPAVLIWVSQSQSLSGEWNLTAQPLGVNDLNNWVLKKKLHFLEC